MALCMDESNKNNYRGFIESFLAQMGQNSYELVTINQWLGPVPAGSTNCFFAVFKRQAPWAASLKVSASIDCAMGRDFRRNVRQQFELNAPADGPLWDS